MVFLVAPFAAYGGGSPAQRDSLSPAMTPETPTRFGGMDPTIMKAAAVESMEILNKVLESDRNQNIYSDSLVQRLADFYKYGVGTAEYPGDPLVTRKVCREFVIAMLWDLFIGEAPPDEIPAAGPGNLQNPLDELSAARFRRLISGILPTVRDDLSFTQRTRVYRLAGKVFNAVDDGPVSELERLAKDAEMGPGERALIEHTLELIHNNALRDRPQ